jgi:hypothetical protein
MPAADPNSPLKDAQAKHLTQLEAHLKILTKALDDIASDYAHMKRQDMVEKAGEALCRVGAWGKTPPGHFVRHGTAYKLPKYGDGKISDLKP